MPPAATMHLVVAGLIAARRYNAPSSGGPYARPPLQGYFLLMILICSNDLFVYDFVYLYINITLQWFIKLQIL